MTQCRYCPARYSTKWELEEHEKMCDKKATRPLQPSEKVLESLLALKQELIESDPSGTRLEMLWKINSCLFGKYPI
jgi:hypothetical protein